MESRKINLEDRRDGFSLVELLVVVSIVVILIALLLPSLRKAREISNQTTCLSQLHQLGNALAMYSNSNHNWLPAWSGWHVYPPGSPGDDPGIAWTEELMPYYCLPTSREYCCPSFGKQAITYFLAGRWAASQGLTALKITDVLLATKYIISGDDTNRHLYAPPYGDAINRTTDDCDQDDANSPCVRFPDQSGGFKMHVGGNNYLFADMHASTIGSYDLSQISFDPRTMKGWDDVPSAKP